MLATIRKTRDCSRTGDLDRISALPDDLLHVILGFLADAHAVTSTAVLSRRWRRVWVHAKNLAFTDRLEKLVISEPRRLRQLVLRSEALGELEVTLALGLRTLDVTAPSLRAVRLTLCFHNPMRGIEDAAAGKVARIAAPRLEEISMHCFRNVPPPELDIHDLASVRRLDKLWLEMHGKYCHRDVDVGSWLLEKEKPDAAIADDEFVDLTAEGAPPFANVRSMELSAWCLPARDLVPSIGLEALEEVEITGFTGAHEEMQLVTTLFESSKNSIRRMTLGGVTQIKPKTIHLKWNTAEEDGGDDDDDDDTDTIDEQLMKIPITDRGCWHFAKEVFTWMFCTQ
uniref:F-box domain-containing protein n=1 Tax=Setaria viridis TaxID=4556 RepID=A0A4V6D8Z0_SETVI|nr:hypothetical protein SEVIR_6G245700v2 [Setaria viridis]